MTTFKTKYNRRSFLKVSAATSGGMVLGFSWFASCNPTAPAPMKGMPEAWFDINAYLKIGENGLVTIMSPNPEIGQNIKTSMPMIIAEELDVAWRDVIVEQAPLNTDWYTRQVAGGSQSIRHGWESLRMAGATARKMLLEAAAKRWEVEASTLSVADGIIKNAKNETLGYGDVAADAANIEVPEEATLKDPKDFKIIGKSKTNVDLTKIITGQSLFGLDYKREGMEYAVVLRPPAFGQKLVSVDDADAKKVNGVTEVIKFGDKVAVLATSTWAAMKGKKALKAEWKQASVSESTTYHSSEMKAVLAKEPTKVARNNGDVEKAFAEADEVMERTYEAPFLPHNCMEPMNFFAHVTDEKVDMMGPIQTPQWTQSRVAGALGMIDQKSDGPTRQAALAKIKIGMTRMGGGFGRRLYGDFALEAAVISQKSNKPIKVVYTREDDMTAGTYRPASVYKIKAAIKDNQITGYQLNEVCFNGNMYGIIPNFFPAGAIENYQVNNFKIDSNITTGAWRAPYTNFLASAEQGFFDELAEKLGKGAVDLRLELLANADKVHKKADADFGEELKTKEAAFNTAKEALEALQKQDAPDEKILKVFNKSFEDAKEAFKEIEGKINNIKGNYEPNRMIDVMKLVVEKGNWDKEEAGIHKGLSLYYCHNTYVAQIAHLRMIDDKPKVEKITCAVDCGIVINPVAAINLIQGGVIDGVGHSMYSNFSFKDGQPEMQNFDKYRLIRMKEAPKVDVHFVENGIDPTGLGEPTLPPVGAAIANALYKATGKRLYKQPYIGSLNPLG